MTRPQKKITLTQLNTALEAQNLKMGDFIGEFRELLT
jgi:hypothetical protein